jgi:hypothetical protein
MKEHNTQSGHAITVSYSDFSFWCYECDSYIAHDIFRPLLALYVGAPPRYTFNKILDVESLLGAWPKPC